MEQDGAGGLELAERIHKLLEEEKLLDNWRNT